MQVPSLGGEDPLEEGTATHSSVLAWGTPRTEEPGGPHPWCRKRDGHNSETKQQTASRPRLATGPGSAPRTQVSWGPRGARRLGKRVNLGRSPYQEEEAPTRKR